MDAVYPLAPVAGYLAAGSLKFLVNTLREGRPAFHRIGLGGAPSTHTTIVTTTAGLIGLRGGLDQPMFALALTLAMIVMIDAMDLRRKVGRQATVLKALFPGRDEVASLRERIGHTPAEVLAGLATGAVCAFVLNLL
ncbi:MAG TPA: divergent PAP2 family protein [Azospirillaceae bacterium]|nr:divergent PAP2 family protein [Azospirillaceae bacterium]